MTIGGKSVFVGAFILLIGPLTLIFLSENGYRDMVKLRNEKAALTERLANIDNENIEVYRIIKRLEYDPEFIESLARRELGMISADEWVIKEKERRP